jgi:glycosyltransferase involved in cell wall biosynthesis
MTDGTSYTVTMFAYNEERGIRSAVESVFNASGAGLNRLLVIANGCTDATAEIVRQSQLRFGAQKLQLVELKLGDKCNAWNHYIHELATDEACHFFVDADVKFSVDSFDILANHLGESPSSYHVVAGLPLSGRNCDYYRSLVKERACFFGNFYGLRSTYIQLLRDKHFRLPIGLNWIDSFLTKAANTDLGFGKNNLPERVTYVDGVGYYVGSLSPFRWRDIRTYRNRIARYELGKIQEIYLDEMNSSDWPEDMDSINRDVWEHFSERARHIGPIKRALVRRRLRKLLSARDE